jgi:hypothetical protein
MCGGYAPTQLEKYRVHELAFARVHAHELAFARLHAQEFVRANSNVTKIAEIIIRRQIHQKEQQIRDVQFILFVLVLIYVICNILRIISMTIYGYYINRRR